MLGPRIVVIAIAKMIDGKARMTSIAAISALSTRPPAPEWGAMLNDARDYWVSAPWALIFPGLAITALVLGFNLLGDGLREALDPNAR